ncbi:unnamed protein product [Trichobilharzia regenti]|nr:unnamed protein product [Trichobilharzia regenti]
MIDTEDLYYIYLLINTTSNSYSPTWKAQARTNHSHMRIHQLENINRALDFLSEEGAHLENVGAQDIVDGNPRLTLGLIWTIILHYQVQDIIVKESDETGEVRHAKDALLLWCQLKTAGYPQVEIVDFTKSWRDSLAFAALLHRHYPNLIDFDEIRCIENSQVRLEIIFQQAYLHLGIPILIESKDFIQTCWLEERCVLTLVATWYRCLTTSHSAQLSCERVTKVIQQSLAISHRIFEYMKQTKRWLKWCSVNNKLLNQLLVKLNATDAIRNELDVKQELQNLLSWRQKEKAEKMSDLVQLETLLSEIHTSQLAASHRLFKPPNGLHLNDLEESWKSLTIVEHNCHLAIIDELLRRNELITYRHQITSSRHKHAALISDTETYVNLKLQRLCELSSILTSSINYSLRDKYKKQWNMILEGNRKLQDKLNSRENYLKLCQEWLDLLLQLNDQLQKFGIKMLQLKHLTEVNRTNSVDTCLDQIQMDMNQLVIWIESVKDLLNNITSSENRHIDDSESDATPRTHLQMNVVNSLNYIERYRSNLEKNLWETSQWNVAVKNVYRLLNEINEELLWIKDQENSIEPPNFNKNELAEHFSCVSITTHQLQSKSRLLDAELQSRYKVNYFHHSFLVSNQSLCKHLQQVISQINPADFYQLSIDDINSLSIIHSTQLLEKSQEYPEKMINELNKCVLIKIYEDILKCMQELYTQSDNSNNSNDQNSSPNTSDTCEEIRCKERQTKTIEFVGLLQRYWSKLLESIKVIQNKLLQHNHYLNVLHSLVLANMKIEETSLRICETYNSVNITLMLANKTGNVEEFEEDKQSQKESQMGTLLKEPFDMLNAHTALTVDKEVVINSTLRQMDHIIEQLKLFPKHLIRLRKEVSIFLVSKSVLNENDYAEYLRLETKLNNLSTHRQQRKEIRFQSAHKVDDDQGEDKSTSYSDNVSVTGAQTISSSFEDEVVPVIHKWSIEEEEEIKDERQEEKDDTQTEKPIEQGETINIKKDDGQDVSFTNESVENIAVFTSALSKSSCEELREDNDSDEYFENDFKTPLNSPEAHELSILLLPHISTIAYYLLNRLDFIHMNLKDYVEDCLRQRDILEIQRNVLRLVDNVTSLESWIEEKEKILLTFNPIIYPSVKFIQSLPKPCPIVVTKEIIQSISQLSVQAYRFKTFENELKSHANLRLSEIGMLDQGLCDTFSKLDKEKDMDILHFIKATIKINSPGDEYDVDEDNEDEDEEEGSESRDEFSQETHEEIHFEDSNKQEEEESPHEKKTATYDAYEDEEADDEEVEEEEEQRQQQRHRRNKIDIFRSKYSKLLDHVTKRWQRLKILIEARHERFELAATLSTFHTLFQSTKEWIIRKRELLISTDDLGTDLNSVMQLQRRLMGWERDFIALQGEVEHLNVEGEKLAKELIDEAPQRRDLYLISGELYASKEVGELIKELNKEWESLQLELRNRQDKLLASAELQQFFQGLDDNQLWLRNIEISVATHQLPQSVEEAKIELDLHKELGEQILARKEEFADLISYGRCITAGETDIHYVQLDQRLDRLENGWSELMQMWTYQQKLLQQDVKIQSKLHTRSQSDTQKVVPPLKLMENDESNNGK